MANNYEEVVGVIKVKLVTPVIRALFGCYNLNEKYPGNGEAYIARGEFLEQYASWENMVKPLEDLCTFLKVPFESSMMQEPWIAQDLSNLLTNLFTHFGTMGTDKAAEYVNFLTDVDPYETPELLWLYEIAKLMDDGHGLSAYQVDAAYYCDKPRLGEFGGWGEYHSNTYSAHISSHMARVRSAEVERMLVEKDYTGIGSYMGAQFANVIHGITDPYARQQVTQAVVHNLSNVYKPIPQGEPATNDSAPANAYDNTRVLTAGEQRKLMADALYHTANTWAHNENYDPVTRVFNAVRDAAQLFEFGDDHNVPPMRLIPQPFVEPVMETETQQQWLLHTPMPSATQASSIVRSFDTLVETLGTRRAEAAKKMFGT